jgi:transposase-like protein
MAKTTKKAGKAKAKPPKKAPAKRAGATKRPRARAAPRARGRSARWTDSDRKKLLKLWKSRDHKISEIAAIMGRHVKTIYPRLKELRDSDPELEGGPRTPGAERVDIIRKFLLESTVPGRKRKCRTYPATLIDAQKHLREEHKELTKVSYSTLQRDAKTHLSARAVLRSTNVQMNRAKRAKLAGATQAEEGQNFHVASRGGAPN